MPTVSITARQLSSLVSPVLPIASKDDMLPVLTAVLIQSHDGWLTATATDRFRLGIKRTKHAEAKAGEFSALVRTDDLRRILSTFKPGRGNNGDLTLTVDGGRLTVESAASLGFAFAEARMAFTLVEGEYPKVASIIRDALERDAVAEPVGFSTAFLAGFQAAGGGTVQVKHVGPQKPALFIAEDFIGALMPRKADDLADEAPWTDLLAAPKKNEAGKKAAA